MGKHHLHGFRIRRRDAHRLQRLHGSQAVIVEVYTLSVLSLAGVLVCMLRWIYAPHQHRYLYLAFFWFGICFNNHQSLLVVALGLEVAVMAVQPRLARELFFWNVVCWAGG